MLGGFHACVCFVSRSLALVESVLAQRNYSSPLGGKSGDPRQQSLPCGGGGGGAGGDGRGAGTRGGNGSIGSATGGERSDPRQSYFPRGGGRGHGRGAGTGRGRGTISSSTGGDTCNHRRQGFPRGGGRPGRRHWWTERRWRVDWANARHDQTRQMAIRQQRHKVTSASRGRGLIEPISWLGVGACTSLSSSRPLVESASTQRRDTSSARTRTQSTTGTEWAKIP